MLGGHRLQGGADVGSRVWSLLKGGQRVAPRLKEQAGQPVTHTGPALVGPGSGPEIPPRQPAPW